MFLLSFIDSLKEVGTAFTSDITCFIDVRSQDSCSDRSFQRFYRVLDE